MRPTCPGSITPPRTRLGPFAADADFSTHRLPTWPAHGMGGKAGIGTYTTTVDLPGGWTGGHGAYLDLGTVVGHLARDDQRTRTTADRLAGPVTHPDRRLPADRDQHDHRTRRHVAAQRRPRGHRCGRCGVDGLRPDRPVRLPRSACPNPVTWPMARSACRSPWRCRSSRAAWSGRVSNDAVGIAYRPDDPRRTGSYAKTLAFTLSTTTP